MKSNTSFNEMGHYDHLFPDGQLWFSPKETGDIIGRSDQFVRNSFYSGKILGHLSNGLAPKGREKKTYLRVHRDAIVMFLLESANYTPDSFINILESVISHRSRYQLLVLEKYIEKLLSQR